MGSKNLDRWSAKDWRATAETVRKMDAAGWRVSSVCLVCHLAMETDLKQMVRLGFGEVSLWNRRAPCRRIGCDGKVRFMGKPPGVRRLISLDAEWAGVERSYPPGQR
ncbi:MAG: hypothetical protein ABIO39_06280 [Caulobacteraceae bacterium]